MSAIPTMRAEQNFPLGIPGFRFMDLYDPNRLQDLLKRFDENLTKDAPQAWEALLSLRSESANSMAAPKRSELLLQVAPYVGQFLAKLFGVTAEREALCASTRRDFEYIFAYKDSVVKRVAEAFTVEALATWDLSTLSGAIELLLALPYFSVQGLEDEELAFATLAMKLESLQKQMEAEESRTPFVELGLLRSELQERTSDNLWLTNVLIETDPVAFAKGLLDLIERWTFAALHKPEAFGGLRHWFSIKHAERIDYNHLVECHEEVREGYAVRVGPEEKRRRRDGFTLTDLRASRREANYEIDQCVICHERDNDNCSKGQRAKDGSFRKNPLGVTQIGCPLEERISEFFALRRQGDSISALAMISLDNPMVPGTGHRICNECMKACVFQRVREPVNIPQVETNVLMNVLEMPYGFEIYSLLTRWNPLNIERPCALPYNGKKVLVVGLGPAGYTLSHYLLNEGFGVVAIDALKLEPLPASLLAADSDEFTPVVDYKVLFDDLGSRTIMGFGGVAEYGITVRWDKNFLKVIYLNLARRSAFRSYGGVRLGSTLTIDDAWAMGFDHIAMASGAGKPTVIGLKNNLARGIRKASDFLMALQLSGAAKKTSLANLQVRLPAGVIGGGLTATDAVTELLAYYPLQVEKTLDRFERLSMSFGEAQVWERFDKEEREILEEFLAHGRAIRAERARAKALGEDPDFLPLLRQWGGVTLFYRKGMNDSPAYCQNHEEIIKAMEEGLVFAEGMNPIEAITDANGQLSSVRFEKAVKRDDGKWVSSGEEPVIPLRTLLVAAGTAPNTIYENEYPGTFKLDGNYFQRFEPVNDTSNHAVYEAQSGWALPKEVQPAPFTSYAEGDKRITYYGDNHPIYAGNVVKAMASAKDGYPYIVKLFENAVASLDPSQQAQRWAELGSFQAQLDDLLLATVDQVNRLTPTIVEVVIRAPLAARKFQPGQFYRVQNFESYALRANGTSLATEGIALTGAWVDKAQGLVGVIALEMGTSSRLCATWKAGDRIVLMGPTGTPTTIPNNETVALLGGGLGNAVLFSIGKALREKGNRVLYFAGYRSAADVFKTKDIEEAADVIVWSVDKNAGVEAITPTRPQDKTFVGNIVEAMLAYTRGELGETPIALSDVERLIVIGSDRMMEAVKAARFNVLKPYLKAKHAAIGSINSPMQCMMKGVCAQCMCKHVDPETGKESYVYTCYDQDQKLDEVDFPHLRTRLRQNTTQEKLANLWLDHVFNTYEIPRI